MNHTDSEQTSPQTLQGKRALVCGASSGIGRATAKSLAKQGAAVSLLSRSNQELEQLQQEIQAQGGIAWTLAQDLEDQDGLEETIQKHLQAHGPLHILINNAGGPPPGRLLDASPQDFLPAFQRHLFAAHRLVQLLLPGMQDSGYGRILNIISTSVREPIPNLGVSNTLRGAMASWAKSLANELPPGVTINNILPGFTATERLFNLRNHLAANSGRTAEAVEEAWLNMVPEGRLGQPEELGEVITFLASPQAAYIRGVSLPVDGGRLRSI